MKNHPVFTILILLLLSLLPAEALVAADGPPLPLDQAITTALRENPRLKAQGGRVKAAKAGEKASRGSLYPRLDAYAGYTRTSNPMLVIPMKALPPADDPTFSRNHYTAGFSATLPLYQGGRRWARITMAELEKKISDRTLSFSRQELIANVTNTFNRIISLQALEDSQTKALAALKKARNDARRRQELGRAAPVEVMKMEAQVAREEYDLAHTRQARLRARQLLAALLGRNPEPPPRVTGTLSDQLPGLPPDDNAHLETLIAQRPDLEKATRKVELAQNAIQLEKGWHLPEVDLVGDYGRRAGSGMNDHEDVWSAGVNLRFNLFAGGTIQSRVHQAEAQLESARQEYLDLKLKALTEARNARTRIDEAERKLEMARKAIASARESYRSEDLKYQTGAGTVTDSLLAQSAWFQAEALKAEALYELNTAVIDFKLATGIIAEGYSDADNARGESTRN
jgi:outer membrane protein